MDLTIQLLRPDDLLVLVVEATNMRLDTSEPRLPRLVRRSPGLPALLTFRFPPQSIIERAYFETATLTSPPFNPPPPPLPGTSEQPDLPGQVAVRMSGESRLVFRLPGGLHEIPYSTEGLLDWSRLVPVLPPAASVPPGAAHLPGHGPPAIAEPGPEETALELPYRLVLAPNVAPHAGPAWVHATVPVDHAGRTELWHTRLASLAAQPGAAPAEASRQHRLPVRAVWSPDFVADGPIPDRATDTVPFRSAMSAADRDQIVILSAGFSGYMLTAPDGDHSYVPEPVQAERLFLSALGGWLTSRGSWDFPVSYLFVQATLPLGDGQAAQPAGRAEAAIAGAAAAAPRAQVAGPGASAVGQGAAAARQPGGVPGVVQQTQVAALDLVEWNHVATQGRDHYVRIVYEGFLYPFGHRATLIKITERKVLAPHGSAGNQAGSPVAYLRQRMYIAVREREKTYTTAAYAFAGREMPLAQRVHISVDVTPDIDPAGAANSVGQESFWITINGTPYQFPLIGRDTAGQDVNFLAPLIFVSLRETQLTAVHDAYTADNDRRRCAVRGHKIAYADPAAGDTVLKTTSLYFTAELSAAGPPYAEAPFLPRLDAAAVTVPSLAALLGQNTAVLVELYQPYLDHDLDPHAGVFVNVVGAAAPVPFSADRSGGFARPNIALSALSARKGLVSGAAADAANGVIRPSEYFGAADAKLFGAIELANLLPLVDGLADAAQNAPEIRTRAAPNRRHPRRLETVITWEPQLTDHPPTSAGVDIVFNPTGQVSALSLKVTLEDHLDGTPPSSVAHGSLTSFELTMSGVIGLKIDAITFDSRNGAKLTVALHLAKQHPIGFVGPLEFVQRLADILPPGLFGESGPSIKLGPTALQVSYTLGLPPITCGAFSLEHIAITAGLDLPYLDGKPAVEFAFASRHRPFLVTVEIFGGGGFVHVVLDADGIQMVEGAIEFGANFALNVGVASGAVHAMAGIYFQLKDKASDLTGFIDIGGEVSVLGIISISIDLNLSLSWQHTATGNVIQGRATLTVSVHILFFSASVQLSVERSFSAGSGDPDAGQVLSPADWALYAGAFG